jgi:hypothetical protein
VGGGDHGDDSEDADAMSEEETKDAFDDLPLQAAVNTSFEDAFSSFLPFAALIICMLVQSPLLLAAFVAQLSPQLLAHIAHRYHVMIDLQAKVCY